jgi:hypothetical protein
MNLLGNACYSPPFPLNPCLDSEGQNEETKGASEDYEEVYTKGRIFPVESKAWITPSPMGTTKEPRRRPTTSSLE